MSPRNDILHHSTRRPLDPIFSPKSVAVIGATETVGSVGRTILDNLIKGGFAGNIYPVNPKRPTVLGLPALHQHHDRAAGARPRRDHHPPGDGARHRERLR